MPGTIPALELKKDGDVESVTVKQAGEKLVLKDIQAFLKKKTAASLITSYAYGDKRLSVLGYTTGKDSEISQHQLPPPCDNSELYGSLLVLVHPIKTTWDSSVCLEFSPSDYELFYEKCCSGDLEEEIEEEGEGEGEEEVEEELEEENVDMEEDIEQEEIIVEEEEEVPKPRVIKRVAKVDLHTNQFKFKSVLVEETQHSLETIQTNVNRLKTFTLLKQIFEKECTESELLALELGIYNATLKEGNTRKIPLTWEHTSFQWLYDMVTKRVVSNFYSSSYVNNQTLFQRWKEGEFTLDQLGSWNSYELHPAQWKDLKDQQFRREKKVLEGNLAMATDRFKCSVCKKKMCSYYELQTRSADEPMTIFITCLNCGKQWRQ